MRETLKLCSNRSNECEIRINSPCSLEEASLLEPLEPLELLEPLQPLEPLEPLELLKPLELLELLELLEPLEPLEPLQPLELLEPLQQAPQVRETYSSALAHHFRIPHSSHLGLRAWQIYLPCSSSQWCALGMRCCGMYWISVFSVCSGFLLWVVSPMRSLTLNIWVSTAIVGWFHATAHTTLAVLRPTPGRVCSASTVLGTCPW